MAPYSCIKLFALWLAAAAALAPQKNSALQQHALPRRAMLLAPLVAVPRAAFAADAAAARTQWKAAAKEIDDILSEWDSITGGGDGIRRRIGTVGTSSPARRSEPRSLDCFE